MQHRDTFKTLEENLQEELLTLFPKQYTKKLAGLQNQALDMSASSAKQQTLSGSKQGDESQKQSPTLGTESDQEKKLKNKINFHVLVRNTKLY